MRPLIVSYHAVSSSWRSPLAVSPGVLRRQLTLLRSRGFTGLTFTESERRKLEGDLPKRCVVVTFDDGYASTLKAKAILDEVGFPATVFVVTSFADSGEPLRWRGLEADANGPERSELEPLTWSALELLANGGWEVGSHTVSHALLPGSTDAAVSSELEGSRARIAERLGSCSTLAYPYGVADARVAAAAERAGYLAACTLRFVHREDERYRRPRVGLSDADVGLRLHAQLSAPALRLRRSVAARWLQRIPRRRSWLPRHDDDSGGSTSSSRSM